MTAAVGAVAVHDLGGAGTPLLISHATGFHGLCYAPMAGHLTEHFHCVAFDYRGHGDTPLREGWEVSWSDYSEDAEAVALGRVGDGGAGPLVGFGHSMGGACLLMVAHRRPALFSHLVLFEPIVPPPDSSMGAASDPSGSPLVIAARRRRATFGSSEEAFANYANKPPLNVFHPDALWAYVSHGFSDDPEGVRLKCSPELEAATFAQGGQHRTWELLGEIDIPVLVLAGKLGADQGPASMAPAIAEALPGGSLRQLDRIDHFGPMSHPDRVADAISSFCQKKSA